MDEVHVGNEGRGFAEIRNAVQRLYDLGYKAVDVRTSTDEQGRFVVTVTPREEK